MKKIITLLLAVFMTICSFGVVGCSNNQELDGNKTQLYVHNYNGGVGEKWIKDVKASFEAKYEKKSFQAGKTGVQIILDSSKGKTGRTILSGIKTDPNEVFFTQEVLYYDYVGQNAVLPLNDLLEKKNPEDNDKTILSKFTAEDVENLTVNGNIYAIPYYEAYNGLSYDATMFKNQNLYFSDKIDTADTKYPGTRAFVNKINPTLSCGPDGIKNTYDDGLPSSFDELLKLCDKMNDNEVKAVVWASSSVHYTNILLSALYASYMGKDGLDAHMNLDSNGKPVEIVTRFNGETPVVENIVITKENSYLLRQSAALYYSLNVCAKLYGNEKYCYSESLGGNLTYIGAQEAFVNSGLKSGYEEVGLIIEGNYWFNEATDFEVISEAKKYPDFTNKDIKFLPLPNKAHGTVEEGQGSSPTLVDSYNSFTFIKSNIAPEKIELAKTFLAYCNTDAQLLNFTSKSNGLIRGLNYDFNSLDNLGGFAESTLAIRDAAKKGGTFVRGISNSSSYMKNTMMFTLSGNADFWNSEKCGDGYNYLYYAVNTDKKSAKDYFDGMKFTKEEWDNKFVK